jgi:hypothetical protein
MNGAQRLVTFLAAVILLLVAFSESIGAGYEANPWIALVAFVLAVIFFILGLRSAQD